MPLLKPTGLTRRWRPVSSADSRGEQVRCLRCEHVPRAGIERFSAIEQFENTFFGGDSAGRRDVLSKMSQHFNQPTTVNPWISESCLASFCQRRRGERDHPLPRPVNSAHSSMLRAAVIADKNDVTLPKRSVFFGAVAIARTGLNAEGISNGNRNSFGNSVLSTYC